MIAGFEEYTQPLTSRELFAIPTLVNLLNNAKYDSQLKNRQIAGRIYMRLGNEYYFHSSRIRKMINHVSVRKLTSKPLLATSKGYYTSGDKDDIQRYLSSLQARVEAIQLRRSVLQEWQC